MSTLNQRVIIELREVYVPENWDELTTHQQKELMQRWIITRLHSIQIK